MQLTDSDTEDSEMREQIIFNGYSIDKPDRPFSGYIKHNDCHQQQISPLTD